MIAVKPENPATIFPTERIGYVSSCRMSQVARVTVGDLVFGADCLFHSSLQ
jgi:hypothetical protein